MGYGRKFGKHFLIVLSLLVAVEVILRVGEPGETSPVGDPLKDPALQVHFDRLFSETTRDGVVTMVSRFRFAQDPPGQAGRNNSSDQAGAARFLQFPLVKARETRRIFILGSSPVWGAFDEEPDRNTLLAWHLDRILKRDFRDLGVRFQIVNAAQVGFGGPEVIRSAQEVVGYEPDLLVVYNGGVMPLIAEGMERSELTRDAGLLPLRRWLRSLRLVRLVGMLILDSPPSHAPAATVSEGEMLPAPGSPGPGARPVEIGPDGIPMFSPGSGRLVQPAIYSKRTVNLVGNLIRLTQADYRKTYQQTLKPPAERKVPVIMCTVATNIAGLPPFWSLHWEPMGEGDLADFDRAYRAGRRALEEGRTQEALVELDRALALSPSFADAQYLYGRALEDAGRRAQARDHYHRAKEFDASNERALDRPNEILKEVAAAYGATVVDSEAVIARLDPDGVIGNDLFIDHQHPNGRALAALAEEIARRIPDILNLPAAAGPNSNHVLIENQ